MHLVTDLRARVSAAQICVFLLFLAVLAPWLASPAQAQPTLSPSPTATVPAGQVSLQFDDPEDIWPQGFLRESHIGPWRYLIPPDPSSFSELDFSGTVSGDFEGTESVRVEVVGYSWSPQMGSFPLCSTPEYLVDEEVAWECAYPVEDAPIQVDAYFIEAHLYFDGTDEPVQTAELEPFVLNSPQHEEVQVSTESDTVTLTGSRIDHAGVEIHAGHLSHGTQEAEGSEPLCTDDEIPSQSWSCELELTEGPGEYRFSARHVPIDGSEITAESNFRWVTVEWVTSAEALDITGPTRVTETEAVTYTAELVDGDGYALGDVTEEITITSDHPEDDISGNQVSLAFTPELTDRTLVFSYTGQEGEEITAELDVAVDSAVDDIEVTTDADRAAVGTEVAVSVEAFGDGQLLGEVTEYAAVSFEDENLSGGSFTIPSVGDHQLTATYRGLTDTASVTGEHPVLESLEVFGHGEIIETLAYPYEVGGTDQFGDPIAADPENLTVSSTVDADAITIVDGLVEVDYAFTPDGPIDRLLTFTYALDGELVDEVQIQETATSDFAGIDLEVPSEVAEGHTVPVTVTALNEAGVLGEVTDYAELSSSEEADEFTDGQLRVSGIGERVISAQYRGEVIAVGVTVVPGAPAALDVTGPTEVTETATGAYTVVLTDEFGNELGEVTEEVEITSSAPEDQIAGHEVSFAFTPELTDRELTFTYRAENDAVLTTTVGVDVLSAVQSLALGVPESVGYGQIHQIEVTALDEAGAQLGVVTDYASITSDDAHVDIDGAEVRFTGAGQRVLTAEYRSHTTTATVEVDQAATEVIAVVDRSTITAGEDAVVDVTVLSPAPREHAPPGEVDIWLQGADFDQDEPLATGELTDGEVSLQVNGLTDAGDYELVARYSGAADFAPSGSGSLAVTVVPAAPASLAVTGPRNVTETDSAAYRVQATDSYGNVVGWVTSDTEITSDIAADDVGNNEVTFAFTPEELRDRTLSFTYTGQEGQEIATEMTVEVASAVEGLALAAPAAAEVDDAVTISVEALDAEGAVLGEVAQYADLASSMEGDVVVGSEVILASEGQRTLTATYRDLTGALVIEVNTPEDELIVPEGVIPGLDQVPVGGIQEATSSGYAPGVEVSATMYSDPLGIGTETADETGTVTFTWQIPENTEPGEHTVVLSAPGYQDTSAGFEVVAAEEEPTPTPTEEPTPMPTEEPIPTPTEEPSPTPEPTPTPTPTESPEPTEEPTPSPTEEPSPTPEPTPTPTEEPIPTPTKTPTPTPTEEPLPTPEPTPTPTPTESPEPAEEPTPSPTEEPSPTQEPTATPTPPEPPEPTEEPMLTPAEGPSPAAEPTLGPPPAVDPAAGSVEGAEVIAALTPTPTPSSSPSPSADPSPGPDPGPAPEGGPDEAAGSEQRSGSVAEPAPEPALGAAASTTYGQSLRSPAELLDHPVRNAVTAAAIALMFTLLAALPSELLYSTLRANYTRAFGWAAGLGRWWPRWVSGRRLIPDRRLGLVILMASGAVLGVLAETDPASPLVLLRLYLAVLASVIIMNAASALFSWCVVYGRYRIATRIRAMPGFLLLAAISVAASRVLDLQPGILFGLLVTVVVLGSLSPAQQGTAAAVAGAGFLALGLTAWIAYTAIDPAAEGFFTQMLRELLTTLTIGGIGSTLVAMLPLRFLIGHAVFSWSKVMWAVLTMASVVAFVLVIAPLPESWVEASRQTLVWSLGFGAFGVVSVAVWAWFRFRPAPDPAPGPLPARSGPPSAAA